ncbi:MAG: YjiH family protein [Acidaminobacter sp.]|uniref:YjiH family protein n=1 Tax=Acidaminobacter sp. TaxID=1872102 RepID=UPI00137CEEDB|nr:YjiH family protein [Acidaminobacter sp.]MZQ99293.1 YjiH family protein [Acidaminobacter sp.]
MENEKVINNSNNTSALYSTSLFLKFLIPSIIGLFLFVIPLPYGDNFTIGVGVMADWFRGNWGEMLPGFMTIVVAVSAVLTVVALALKPAFITGNEFWRKLLMPSAFWTISRILGAIFILMTYLEIGPAAITSRATGGTILFDLMPTLATWFFFSGFLLPLLMDFGSMDYFGTLIRKFMRPLFLVPGRSAIDAVASWIGSGPVGVVITNKQYQAGYYTTKEASIIAVCFSLVSLPFAVVVAGFLKISHVFLQFYGAISIASLAAALILPRIYPLRSKKSDYHPTSTSRIQEEVPEGRTLHQYAVERGVMRAKEARAPHYLAADGIRTVVDVYVGLMPLVMAWGTIALIVTEYTPIFTWASYPFILILQALNVPGAVEAAPALVVGFADMFLPSILVANLEFEMTRFIIGAVSFTQLIYMTETGAVILRSDIPISFRELAIIFLERTLITLPIVVLIANLVY